MKYKKNKKEKFFDNANTEMVLKSVLDNIPGHIYWFDKNNKFLGCNNEQAEIFNLESAEEIYGKTIYDFECKEDADHIVKINNRVMETGRTILEEEPFLMPNGEERIYLSRKSPLKNKTGEIIGIIGISLDITEQKKTEKKLLETQHRLDAMTYICTTIAHEVRTPLATVNINNDKMQKYIPFLIKAYEKASSFGADLTEINKQILGRLIKIPEIIKHEINGIDVFMNLLLSNLKPPLTGAKSESFLISECVHEALLRYPLQIKEKELIHFQNDNDFKIKGKKLLVIHLLFNLLKNSLYYIAKAKKGAIKIWLEHGQHTNQLYFEDTGTGISPEILPHIFEQFFSRTYHGAGVGLSYCKTVMEALDGDITCGSEEGHYTRFKLSFPRIELQ